MELEAMPEWMSELSEADMTEDQRRERDEYMDRMRELDEMREKERKALELELKKLRSEVSDIVKAFDDRVRDMAEIRVKVQLVLQSHEM